MKIIWSNDSLGDVDRIREYISQDTEFYAQIFVEKIIQITERLKNFQCQEGLYLSFQMKVLGKLYLEPIGLYMRLQKKI
ncbi:hypothetical protein EDC19_1814 [Natranaerovirga hydrolytica]|uniref:ParE-like toxin of type II ParDE toxin-antitoxin system n=1 Tax=Natranaerovirga hydrolytica TaxID=680378 RepID=A0A4V2Q075_9FIRM|nr:type II toxin-antitoxin system RelE/ParE family toxin [Natranaerovirga hydrolytica]TCK92661.1 hypothetical protein EDC19_1814 [Natranaerovirga hydrolytica]